MGKEIKGICIISCEPVYRQGYIKKQVAIQDSDISMKHQAVNISAKHCNGHFILLAVDAGTCTCSCCCIFVIP